MDQAAERVEELLIAIKEVYDLLGASDPAKPGTMVLAIARSRWAIERTVPAVLPKEERDAGDEETVQ